jgi:hypothetical protein
LVWVLGFELVPNLHVGMHEAFGHHHHGVGEHAVGRRGEARGDGAGHDRHAHDRDHDHGHDQVDAHDHGHVHVHEHDHGQVDDHQRGHVHVDEHDHGYVDEHDHGHVDETVEQASLELAGAVVSSEIEAACESPDDHGRHSLAHRGIAVTPAPWELAAVASSPWTSIERACTPVAEPRTRRSPTARARGPPVLT